MSRAARNTASPSPQRFVILAIALGKKLWRFSWKNAFARRGVSPKFPYIQEGGRGPAYNPTEHHPLLIPTTGASGPNWGFDDLVWAVQQAMNGKIAALTFHGVPDLDHPWVHTPPEAFVRYMEYLRDEGCTVIARRNLVKYVAPAGV
ncbi:hypothetical protein FJZ31_16675 [Candidatus Poribacteria bacterium]|nr:hypothetical protein [Candidatus Poribacteria bacterium]